MTSAYSQLLQDAWFRGRQSSAVEMLMKPHEPDVNDHHSRQRGLESSRQMSEISFLEEQHERTLLNTRNFGYHWLKPLGVSKTMCQAEDEARETHESYEEYEDEEGQFNQNNPHLNGGMEGVETLPEEPSEQAHEEDEDLDEEIEEGASFEVEETSLLSSGPMTPLRSSGLHPAQNEAAVSQSCMILRSLLLTLQFLPGMRDSPISGQQRTANWLPGESPSEADLDGSLESADEGSIGDYSSASAGTASDAD